MIRSAARTVVERAAGGDPALQPLHLEPPLNMVIEFRHAGQADFAATIPGFERTGDRGVAYVTDDAVTLYRAFVSAARLAASADE